ncbi:MAG: hypothetical protein WBA54_04175 [Acidaminobacteraceae bacterium]
MFIDRRKKEKGKRYRIIVTVIIVITSVIYFYWDSSSDLDSGIYPLKETGVYFVKKVDGNGTFDIKIPILYVRKTPLQFSTPIFSNIELYNSENELISEYTLDYKSVVYSKGILNKQSHGEINLTINAKTYEDIETGEVVTEEYFRKQFDHILKTLIFDFNGQRYYYMLGEGYNIKAYSLNDEFYDGPQIKNLSYKEESETEPGYINVDLSGVKNYSIKKSFLWFQDGIDKLLEDPVYYIKDNSFDSSQVDELKIMEFPYLSDTDDITMVYKIDENTQLYLQDKVAIINPFYLIEDVYGNREYIGTQSMVVSKTDISDAIIEAYRVEKIEKKN